MRTNPILFWTTFAAIFVASLFIPVLEWNKPGSESTVHVWAFYFAAAHILCADPFAALFVVPPVLFHVGMVTLSALIATGIYRYLSGQAFQAPSVFASPEPTRSEWETFLAGHEKD